jgi:hypothetical protein
MTRRLVRCAAIVLGVGCGGQETRPTQPAPVPVCSEGYQPPTSPPPAEARDKLDGDLATRLELRSHPCERIVVVVTYSGDREALVAAGLDTGFDQNGVISGIIEKRRVLTLAALPQVIRIVMQPEVHPN